MPASRRFRPSQSTIMYTNAVYYPSQTVYTGLTPAHLNYSCINLVYYAFAKVSDTGHVFVRDSLFFFFSSSFLPLYYYCDFSSAQS